MKKEVRVACYADNVTLITDNEDHLQRLFFIFCKACKQFDLNTSPSKTKILTTSQEPSKCKLEYQRKEIEQVMSLNYLV